jgi:lipid II:glycine glycyltransferase (peptidoglycan interpeptide bridge formation enzyme)
LKLTWRDDFSDEDWDASLVRLGGHPLQSAHWGRARRKAEGLEYVTLATCVDGQPVWMARAEIRKIPFVGSVAWVPKGPVVADVESTQYQALGFEHLAKYSFLLSVSSPWQQALVGDSSSASDYPRTIWIDLAKGKDQLWVSLEKQWRYGVGYAARSGLTVEQTVDERDIGKFFALCQQISKVKGFKLPASLPLMKHLLRQNTNGAVSSHLFLARYQGGIATGVFIIKCGTNIHYMWGATDRKYSKQRPGEATQWAVIEWALEQGCSLYDLEGIDLEGNPGVYAFKKKMGGEEVVLEAPRLNPLTLRGKLIAPLVRTRF